ncbi:MAG: fliK [Alphaproteobacteria bacterium]|nr:fliK [Alphaproteobacteria bacterium]
MPDIRLNTIAADVKARPVMDTASTDISSTQFMDAIMASMTSFDPAEPDVSRTAAARSDLRSEDARSVPEARPAKAAEKVEKNAATEIVRQKNEIKTKIKERLKELASQDTTPVKDTKALKALQKVAKFLVKASEEGTLKLPPEMVQKLKEFVAKGDDLKAFDIASFMQDFMDVFRGITIALPAAAPAVAPLSAVAPVADAAVPAAGTDAAVAAAPSAEKQVTWPADIIAAVDEAGLKNSLGDNTKPLSLFIVLRAVKSLVHAGQGQAIQALDEKAKDTALTPDQTKMLLASASVDLSGTKESAAVKAAPVMAEKEIKKTANIQTPAAVQPAQLNAMLAKPALSAGLATTKKAEAPSLTDLAKEAAAPAPKAVKEETHEARPVANKHETQANAAPQNNAAIIAGMRADLAAPVADQEISVQLHHSNGVENIQLAAPTGGLRNASALGGVQQAASKLPDSPVQQVAVQIQTKLNKATQLSVQLTPLELGRVEVRLSIQRDGQAHAVITADNPETLALLQKDSAQLERSLQQAGINTNAQNMSFNLRDERNAQQPTPEFGKGRKRFSRDGIGSNAVSEASLSVQDYQIISDNRVNYHA